jgi:antitoxin ParD1/3/4
VYEVQAHWDDEARCRWAENTDIPGLVTEAATFDDLVARVMAVAPELLALNTGLSPDADVPIHVAGERTWVRGPPVQSSRSQTAWPIGDARVKLVAPVRRSVAMPTRTVTLTAEQDRLIRELVESGRYQSETEVIGVALGLLGDMEQDEQGRVEALRRAIAVGEAEIAAGHGEDYHAGMLDEIEADLDRS